MPSSVYELNVAFPCALYVNCVPADGFEFVAPGEG